MGYVEMYNFIRIITGVSLFFMICWSCNCEAGTRDDPWARLRHDFPVATHSPETVEIEKSPCFAANDPWQRLRQVIIPFSIMSDSEPLNVKNDRISVPIKRKLYPWRDEIDNAAAIFDIPVAIIEAVIMVESGGNPQARAKTSSAAGLMQTIQATFSEARQALKGQRYIIPDDPFDPYASIMAGSWYLSRMFERAQADAKPGVTKRSDLASWRYPLEYYYAGPGHGLKSEPRILIYSGGKRLLIDKPAYSQKVLAWASKLG